MVRVTSWNFSEKRPFCTTGSSVSLERTQHNFNWPEQFLDRSSWRLGKEFLGGGQAEEIHGCVMGSTAMNTPWLPRGEEKPTMDLRNVPYRSDVLTWDPDDLAEYFRTVSLAVFCLCLMEEQTAVTWVGLKLGYFRMGKARCWTKSKTAFRWEAELSWSVKMHLERHF